MVQVSCTMASRVYVMYTLRAVFMEHMEKQEMEMEMEMETEMEMENWNGNSYMVVDWTHPNSLF